MRLNPSEGLEHNICYGKPPAIGTFSELKHTNNRDQIDHRHHQIQNLFPEVWMVYEVLEHKPRIFKDSLLP